MSYEYSAQKVGKIIKENNMIRVLQASLFTLVLSFLGNSALAGVIHANDLESTKIESVKTEVTGVSVVKMDDNEKYFLVVESIYKAPSSGTFLFRYTMPAGSYEMASALAKDLLLPDSVARMNIKYSSLSNMPNSYDATLQSIDFGKVAH